MKIVITYYDPDTKTKGTWEKEYSNLIASTFYDAIYDFADNDRLKFLILKMEAKKE